MSKKLRFVSLKDEMTMETSIHNLNGTSKVNPTHNSSFRQQRAQLHHEEHNKQLLCDVLDRL